MVKLSSNSDVLRVVAGFWSHTNDKLYNIVYSAYENNLGLVIRNKLKTSI